MSQKQRVLFLCVANSSRSQMAEALLRHLDPEHFEAFSAGSAPTQVDERARGALQQLGISCEGLFSKSIEQVAGEPFDYVITLCDKSAFECSTLPGAGEYIAWDFEDPASSQQKNAYTRCLQQIHERIKMFVLVKSKAQAPLQMLAPVTLFKCLADDTRARMTQLIAQSSLAYAQIGGWGVKTIVAELHAARNRWRAAQQRSREFAVREFPSREALTAIAEALCGALFPMRLGPPDLHQEGEDFYVGHTLDRALNALFQQVQLELGYNRRLQCQEREDVEAHAAEIVQAFARQLPAIRGLLDSDVEAAYQGDPAARSVTLRGEPVVLTGREFDLLQMLLEAAGRVLTRGQLIDRIWGADYVGDTKTLDVHVKRVRAKIEEDPGHPKYLTTVRGLGYKIDTPSE